MVPFITSPLLSSVSGLSHGFFTRQGGVSSGLFDTLNASFTKGDEPKNVVENRRRICSSLGSIADALVTVQQNHTNIVKRVDRPFDGVSPPVADALVTTTPGVILGVTTADCVPVLLAHSSGTMVAAVHAGWRGALSGILQNTVSLMVQLGAAPGDIQAALGPCIWQDSYEVDQAFYDANYHMMASKTPETSFFKQGARVGYWQLDLPGYVEKVLREQGISLINSSPYDTFGGASQNFLHTSSAQFFSCRRATLLGEKTFGCQLSCIGIKSTGLGG